MSTISPVEHEVGLGRRFCTRSLHKQPCESVRGTPKHNLLGAFASPAFSVWDEAITAIDARPIQCRTSLHQCRHSRRSFGGGEAGLGVGTVGPVDVPQQSRKVPEGVGQQSGPAKVAQAEWAEHKGLAVGGLLPDGLWEQNHH